MIKAYADILDQLKVGLFLRSGVTFHLCRFPDNYICNGSSF